VCNRGRWGKTLLPSPELVTVAPVMYEQWQISSLYSTNLLPVIVQDYILTFSQLTIFNLTYLAEGSLMPG
jgi:hypothetical protein